MVKFCPECNNILYPKENKSQKQLFYFCRNCEHLEDAEDHLIYRNHINFKSPIESSKEMDILSDPTFPRSFSVECPFCKNREAIYYVSTENNKEKPLDLTYLCTNGKCGKRW